MNDLIVITIFIIIAVFTPITIFTFAMIKLFKAFDNYESKEKTAEEKMYFF